MIFRTTDNVDNVIVSGCPETGDFKELEQLASMASATEYERLKNDSGSRHSDALAIATVYSRNLVSKKRQRRKRTDAPIEMRYRI